MTHGTRSTRRCVSPFEGREGGVSRLGGAFDCEPFGEVLVSEKRKGIVIPGKNRVFPARLGGCGDYPRVFGGDHAPLQGVEHADRGGAAGTVAASRHGPRSRRLRRAPRCQRRAHGSQRRYDGLAVCAFGSLRFNASRIPAPAHNIALCDTLFACACSDMRWNVLAHQAGVGVRLPLCQPRTWQRRRRRRWRQRWQ